MSDTLQCESNISSFYFENNTLILFLLKLQSKKSFKNIDSTNLLKYVLNKYK